LAFTLGRFDEALALDRKAVELDPLSAAPARQRSLDYER
jgi:hypothetical protein